MVLELIKQLKRNFPPRFFFKSDYPINPFMAHSHCKTYPMLRSNGRKPKIMSWKMAYQMLEVYGSFHMMNPWIWNNVSPDGETWIERPIHENLIFLL